MSDPGPEAVLRDPTLHPNSLREPAPPSPPVTFPYSASGLVETAAPFHDPGFPRGCPELKRTGMASYAGHEAQFNAAELNKWLKSVKLVLRKDEGE